MLHLAQNKGGKSLYIVKTALLSKAGKSGVTWWRQITLLMNVANEQFVLKTYHGKKRNALQREERVDTYDEDWRAMQDFDALKKMREDEGYTEIELLTSSLSFYSLSKFLPPVFEEPTGEALHFKFMRELNRCAVPIYGGRRVYIKIGFEAVTTITGIDVDKNDVLIPKAIKNELQTLIKVGQTESVMLEGYLQETSLYLTDLIAVNGMTMARAYPDRLNTMKALVGECQRLTVATWQQASESLLSESSETRDTQAQYYICKPHDDGFEQNSGYQCKTFIVPNYYVVTAFAARKLAGFSNGYRIALHGNNESVEIGDLFTNTPIGYGETIRVAFSQVEDGMVENAWLAPQGKTVKTPMPEESYLQMENLQLCWMASPYN